MGAIIIHGGAVLTPDGLRRNWGVRVEGSRIDAVAANGELPVSPEDEVLEAPEHLIMPGFVNGHNHMYGFLSHGITAETMVTEFSSFLDDFWWPYVENRLNHRLVAATTAWACVEMIDSGVTSFADILEGPNAIPGALEVEREIVERAGLRGLLSFEACQRISEENGQAGLRENASFMERTAGQNVQGLMSTHTLFTCDESFTRQAKALAAERGGLTHMHLSESVFEPNWCAEHYGKRPVEVYEEWGCLDENTLASQVVQATEKELDILARRGVRVVTMPLSNCEVGGGVAPVPQMLRRGMTVGLGTDGYVNNFFEVMRGAFLIHKAYQQDPQVMPAKTVVGMATSMGARALHLTETGSLEAGKLADLICVRMDTPTPINEHNVYDQLVLFRNPGDVTHVMADGHWLKRDGKLTTLDRERVRRELAEVTDRFWKLQEGADVK